MSACSLPATVGPWFLTDDSCAQYCLKITDTKYAFTSLQLMDVVCHKDRGYCVTYAVINVGEMTFEDVKIAICGFYDSVIAMIESYSENLTMDSYAQIVAECAFENITDDNSISDILPWYEAIKAQQSFMLKNQNLS